MDTNQLKHWLATGEGECPLKVVSSEKTYAITESQLRALISNPSKDFTHVFARFAKLRQATKKVLNKSRHIDKDLGCWIDIDYVKELEKVYNETENPWDTESDIYKLQLRLTKTATQAEEFRQALGLLVQNATKTSSISQTRQLRIPGEKFEELQALIQSKDHLE